MDENATFNGCRRFAGAIAAASLMLAGCGTVQQAQQAVSTVQAAATTVSKAASPTGSASATPAGKAPTPASTPGARASATPRPSPTPPPAVPAGTTVTVLDTFKITAANLRAWTPPDPQWWPIKDHQFVQFDVTYQNLGSKPERARDPLFTLIEDDKGESLSGIGKALDGNSGGLVAYARRGPNIDENSIEIKPGETRTISRTLQVPIGTAKLFYRESLLSERGALAGNPFAGGRWDLGAPPAAPAARADLKGKMGEAIKTDWNLQVKVNEVALFTPDPAKNLLGFKAKEGEVMVRVNASVGNAGTNRANLELGGQIELQDASGKLYNGGLSMVPVDDQLSAIQLDPQKQITGNLVFFVPKAALDGLSVRFHPKYGYGNVVVPVGKL